MGDAMQTDECVTETLVLAQEGDIGEIYGDIVEM